ncbi:MAG: hypothetical protein RR630_00935 [Coprobacillus sp.]
MQDIILSIVSFLLLIIIVWFTYSIINIIATIIRCKKLDHSLKFVFNTKGKVFYSILAIVYAVGTVGGIIMMILGLTGNDMNMYRNGLNITAFVSVAFGYCGSGVVLVGRKNMMVGRMMIDYRKLKKVNFSYDNKVSFVYAQKDYSFSSRFVDITQLRKTISR